MIRLFTALSLPDELCIRLAALRGGIDGARWVEVHNLHITLLFIGAVSEPVADDIVRALDDVRCRQFSVSLTGAEQFSSRGRVRTVWIGVDKTAEMIALHEKIDQALVRTGLLPERRKYTPHVTIGRLQGARPNRVLNWLQANGAFFAPPFEASEFVLYESRLGRNGADYAPVAAFPLEGLDRRPSKRVREVYSNPS